jgi:hypothetical protein
MRPQPIALPVAVDLAADSQDWPVRLAQSGADGVLLAGWPGDGPEVEHQLGQRLEQWLRFPLGSRPLQLLAHRDQLAGAGRSGSELARFLLPAWGSAGMAEQLERLAWLELEHESGSCAAALIRRLRQGRLLLPAAGSLLEYAPWREACLVAIPPPEVLTEALVLWMRPQLAGEEAARSLMALLRQRLAAARQQKTAATGGGGRSHHGEAHWALIGTASRAFNSLM